MASLTIRIGRPKEEASSTALEATLRLGGAVVYAPDSSTLKNEVQLIGRKILQSASQHLSVNRNVLGKLAREAAGIDHIEKRLFGAILGQQLSLGNLDSIVCSSINGKVFRVYIHKDNTGWFRKSLERAHELLGTRSELNVSELENEVFGARSYNTFSSSSQLLARLAYIGYAELIDKYSARLTPGIRDAVR